MMPLRAFVADDVVQGLYDEKQSSMDELGGFEPTDTTGFIQIESIRIKKSVISCPFCLCFRGIDYCAPMWQVGPS